MLTISPEYTRSFNPKNTAQWFFFNGCDSMTVGIPSEYESFDIDGSQIGLSLGTTFLDYPIDAFVLTQGKIGSVWAKPVVENYIIDFDLWYDLSEWHHNLWSRIEFPVVQCRTNMHICSSGKGIQTEEYPLGLFTLDSTLETVYVGGIPVTDQICNATPVPYSSIVAALEGNKGWGSVEPLQSGKFSPKEHSKWGVAGVHFDLGYDIYDSRPWYCAGSIHLVFPTGTRPKGTYVFEPVVGADKSWQIGATAIANYIKEFQNSELGIYFYAVGTHLFKAKQDRVFSLAHNGPGSQLLLIKQFQPLQNGLINAEREANIFCGTAKIGSTLMFDGSLMAQYSRNNLVANLGYNLWARTKEKRAKTVVFRGFYESTFGIKGATAMEDSLALGGPTTPLQCAADTTTDSTATIAASTTPDPMGEADGTPVPKPIFIQPGDIEYGSALHPAAISNKVFASIGYKSSWFVLLSGEAEFGTNNAAINQWGVMLKVGKDF
jgi:hypothetical protein